METMTGASVADGAAAREEPALDVRDLRMRYGGTDVLQGVTFTARRGEVLVLLGPNGAGKTTTIEIHELVHRLTDVDDTTVLLTTHDLDEAEKLADRIVLLAGGRIIAEGSADQLSRRVAAESEIRWSRAGSRYVHSAADATAFVRELFRQYGEEIADLEVRRASLEDTYMTLVRDFEAGRGAAAAAAFEAVR